MYSVLLFVIQTLTTLVLYLNQIGDRGAEHLANALQMNTVRTYFFSHTYINIISYTDADNFESL
jgi:hypothetical protein